MKKQYVLRCIDGNKESYGGFPWDYRVGATVEAPDWEATAKCGGGIHGWLNGVGNLGACRYISSPHWMVLEVTGKIIELDGKVKFQKGKIIKIGNKEECAAHIHDLTNANGIMYLRKSVGDKVILAGGNGSTLTGGDRSTLTGGHNSALTGGDGSTLTGGHYSTLTGGHYSTLTGGQDSVLTGGDNSALTGGDGSTLTGGHYSTLTGGDYSTLTGGYNSTLTGGQDSVLTGGDYSTLTGGDNSTLTAVNRSTLTGGNGSTLIFKYFHNEYCRIKTCYVGEDGIKPGVAYHLNSNYEIEAGSP